MLPMRDQKLSISYINVKKGRDCTRVAPVELSYDPCISLTMTNTFREITLTIRMESQSNGQNSSEMLIFLRIYTFCQVSREFPRSRTPTARLNAIPGTMIGIGLLFYKNLKKRSSNFMHREKLSNSLSSCLFVFLQSVG